MKTTVRVWMGHFFAAVALAGCGGGGGTPATVDMAAGADLAQPDLKPATPHRLKVKIALTDDGMGVSFFTQNGSVVHVKPADIVGKTYFWATVKGGDSVFNGKMIDVGTGTIAGDLTASFQTEPKYPDGPWEMALFISIVGGDPTKGPQMGDLAAFDNTPPPAGDPPVTGNSVRMKVQGDDASVTLINKYFIRF